MTPRKKKPIEKKIEPFVLGRPVSLGDTPLEVGPSYSADLLDPRASGDGGALIGGALAAMLGSSTAKQYRCVGTCAVKWGGSAVVAVSRPGSA